MWSDVAVLLDASDQKIILQTTHQRSSDHPIRMSVCKKKNLRGQATSSRRRVASDNGGVVVSGAWEGFCISWELEAANFLAPEKSCQSTLLGPKKWSICFPATLFFHHFSPFSCFALFELITLPSVWIVLSVSLHFTVKVPYFCIILWRQSVICSSVATVSSSLPSTGGISSRGVLKLLPIPWPTDNSWTIRVSKSF